MTVLSNALNAGLKSRAVQLQRHDQIESHTYAELRRMAESVGRWMTEKRFPRGTRVALLADNHPRWVAVYFGTIGRDAPSSRSIPLSMPINSPNC